MKAPKEYPSLGVGESAAVLPALLRLIGNVPVGSGCREGGASIEEILNHLWSFASKYLPVIVAVMIAVEGVIVTLGEIRTRQMIRDAERKAENRVVNRAIRALEKAGETEGARIVRERIYDKRSSNDE